MRGVSDLSNAWKAVIVIIGAIAVIALMISIANQGSELSPRRYAENAIIDATNDCDSALIDLERLTKRDSLLSSSQISALVSGLNSCSESKIQEAYSSLGGDGGVAVNCNGQYDINEDGVVNVQDLIQVILQWHCELEGCINPPADVNYDGVVNVQDLIFVVLADGCVIDECVDNDSDGFCEISTQAQFDDIRNQLSWNYELINDIHFYQYPEFDYPIGSNEEPFTGILEGNGYELSWILIDKNYVGPSSGMGIFGASKGIIRNLHLYNIQIGTPVISNYNNVGSLVGIMLGGEIYNVKILSGDVYGQNIVGGLIGKMTTTEFDVPQVWNSDASVSVNGYHQVGGFVGHMDGTSIIRNSYTGTFGTISDTYIDPFNAIGGFVGYMADGSEILDSYSQKDINIKDVEGQTGGFAGFMRDSSGLHRVYTNGQFSQPLPNAGGLVGTGEPGISISSSYWDIEESGQQPNGYGSPRTTDEMTSVPRPPNTYGGWDFVDEGGEIWDQIDGEYPTLI